MGGGRGGLGTSKWKSLTHDQPAALNTFNDLFKRNFFFNNILLLHAGRSAVLKSFCCRLFASKNSTKISKKKKRETRGKASFEKKV